MTEANRNLLLRVATAAVLLPAVLWLIWHGGLPFALLIAAAVGAAAFEVNGLPWAPREPGVEPAPGGALTLSTAASVLTAAALPVLAEEPHAWLTPTGLLAALVMVTLADALSFEPPI